MIDLILFAGRIILVILLYVFLFAAMRAGVGLVRGQRRDTAIWCVDVEKGSRAMRGLHVDVLGPVVVGRSPSSDIVIDEPYVSATHARFTIQGPALVLEDLGSTNGTMVNGHVIDQPVTLRDGDEVQVGDTIMRVSRQ
ncbi:MAG: FHA domain-containing protein [Coriobacteriaceae bacterium]|uniref:FHA domain-containing protein n=1 Tax=Tractidigestivibacter sp. TaxID=2847320 RepID=UPI002A81960A|nr:FHA domain-containing protein [Tractidigestivibacter sp.]MCI6549117.1 FHA domain-containing protein [Coriobacteriaceae bacterium]MCI6843300.1 FHA domain-containing protein [Coriobacteriaceae bacterium]MCI7437865.1 FHA domain-containing protein [Coriobacteriaceae bacterium]MDD7584571.1 FHA domain-containing protein [Coriobacteriaceae bacterium]MDY4535543.1 FHA domain-containing protein [Tractidigestivibacter sp.]